ncbi:hypothetical protein C5167_030221 [Papaver somniferum]|uniref:uncharacterized protein LOC113329425 n=1 Tax=Papaver somniferum TaxID=3469 RepID=UPI000E70436E|nr:uncharacterized protein LOC113329425 [Papaver somniferum]RZC86872.1 hypothetical protein C5167_030221 [Papaver somniferum]
MMMGGYNHQPGGDGDSCKSMVVKGFLDCVKHEPNVNKDMERNFTQLLTEELRLLEIEALENEQRSDMALQEAKKKASQYQKEADKCNSGMGTCEEAREKAEADLAAQKRMTEMWELRARQRGWQEGQASRKLHGIKMHKHHVSTRKRGAGLLLYAWRKSLGQNLKVKRQES